MFYFRHLVVFSQRKSADLTPAGLRAGGTVELYRRGTSILDTVFFGLFDSNVEALQHYLQEVSTKITLLDLLDMAKSNIIALSSMYDFYVSIPGSGVGCVLHAQSVTAAGLSV